MRTLKTGTTVVLVYDTDVEMNTKILDENIAFLKRQKGIKEVICIPQVRTKIWAEIPKNNFKKYGNDSEKIKIKSKK